MSDAPTVDGRDAEEILEGVRSTARHYTDEWDPDSGDVGSALLALFSSMAADVTERLDRVPDKHRVAFFDALGFDRRPPQPARLPVTFRITDDVDENVAIPGGTRTVAPAQGARPEQLFELPEGGGFEGTPANLAAVYTVDPDADDVFGHWDALAAGVESQLFTGGDLQEHALNVGHAEVLNLKSGSKIWVVLETNAGRDVFETGLVWEFFGEVESEDGKVEAWHEIRDVDVATGENGTMTVALVLPSTERVGSGDRDIAAETTDHEIAGIESRWLRCRVRTDEEPREGRPQDLFDLEIRSVTLSLVDPKPDSDPSSPDERTSVALDGALSGDVPLKVEPGGSITDLSPFGETWPLRNAFYVACEEAFTKPGVTAVLEFEGAVAPTGTDAEEASVALDERGTVGSTVFVEAAALPESGTLVVSDDAGDVLGSLELEAGTYEDVPVRLDSPLTEETTLRAEIHRGRNSQRTVVANTADVTVTPDGGRDPRLSWEYWNGEGWALLDELEDGTTELRSSGTVSFEVPDDLEPTAVAGHRGRWIRARVVGGEYVRLAYDEADVRNGKVSSSVVGVPPHFESASLRYGRGGPSDDGLPSTTKEPDHLVTFNNLGYGADLAGSLGSGFEPFYGLTDEKGTLYLGFDGQLRGGPVNLLLSLADEEFPEDFYPRVRWECRVDPRVDEWVAIEAEDETEGLTRRGIVSLVFAEPTVRSERFGRDLHWIRARIDGQEFVPATESAETADPASLPVVVEGIDARERRVLLVNTSDREVDLDGYRLEFECGRPDDRTRTFGMGATIEPRGVRVVREAGGEASPSAGPGLGSAAERFVFESLPLDDRVRNAVSLLTPGGTVVTRRVEGEPEPCERWLETVPSAGEPDRTPPVVIGLHPNTGWAYNVETVDGERLGASDGTPGQTFEVSSRPVTEETVWVNELSTLSEAERYDLREADPTAVEAVSGAGEEPVAFWVRWSRVEDFLDSDPDDRHYVLDPMSGRITFGDGTSGRIPPRDADSVRVDYTTGGGTAGNVPTGAVTELVSTLPFVDSVTNPEPGDAGADAESVDAVVARAPSELGDRGRAVSKADFERLAMAASRKLARVRCIPAMDDAGEYSPGWVTLLIVPNDARPKPVPSAELKRRVAEGVSEHAPATLVSHGGADRGPGLAAPELVVRGPSYVEVAVGTTIRAGDVGSISALESRITREVDAFLHPLTGGETGEGWGFGELPCLSDLYALLEGVDGVDHVVDLALSFRGGDESETVTEGEGIPNVAADVLAFGGTHTVEVEGTSGVTETGRNTSSWD